MVTISEAPQHQSLESMNFSAIERLANRLSISHILTLASAVAFVSAGVESFGPNSLTATAVPEGLTALVFAYFARVFNGAENNIRDSEFRVR